MKTLIVLTALGLGYAFHDFKGAGVVLALYVGIEGLIWIVETVRDKKEKRDAGPPDSRRLLR